MVAAVQSPRLGVWSHGRAAAASCCSRCAASDARDAGAVTASDILEGVGRELEERLLALTDFVLFGGSHTRLADAGNFSVRHPFAAVVRIALRFQASFPTSTEFPDVDAANTVFAFSVPVLLLRCQAGLSNIDDLSIYESCQRWG